MSVPTRRAIYGKLSGDTTLTNMLGTPAPGYSQGIYYEQAPSKAAFPYVILTKQASTASYGFASTTVINDEVWLIKGVDKMEQDTASADTVDGIQDRLNTLLTDANLTIAGKTQLYLRRESDIDYSENQDGTEYKHAGSFFRLTVL